MHKFYQSWDFGQHACVLLKKNAPSSAAAMDKLLTKNLREKFLAIGEIKELEKTRKAGDKVEKKKEVVMSDAVKSSLLYLEEDVQGCREHLPRVMAVPAEAAQIVAIELSLCGSTCQPSLWRLRLQRFVAMSPQRRAGASAHTR